ncbi:MAG: hypothetical protein ACE5JJ_11920 [Nitrospinota bacterium]
MAAQPRRGGRFISWLALLISLVALWVSYQALLKAGGSPETKALQSQLKELRESSQKQLKAMRESVDAMRSRMAEALKRGEEAIRPEPPAKP